MNYYWVFTEAGRRTWQAEDFGHAEEQHVDAFPDESITSITKEGPVE